MAGSSNPMRSENYYHHDHDDRRHQNQDHDLDQDQTVIKQNKGRGKIDIKFIPNPTNRQVTYSKRRSGIMKKAKELEVLCDAKVSVIMVATNSSKVHDYTSPGVTTKEMIDMYQQRTETDLWKPQYEKMMETLRELKEKNYQVKTEIRQRMGQDLEDLSFKELTDLEDNMSKAVDFIREQKYKKIASRAGIISKKVRSLESNNETLQHDCQQQGKCENVSYRGYRQSGVEVVGYEPAVMALANGAYVYRNGQVDGGGFDPYIMHDLRLA